MCFYRYPFFAGWVRNKYDFIMQIGYSRYANNIPTLLISSVAYFVDNVKY